jgi:23S rRNA pseudouridine2605 synthase
MAEERLQKIIAAAGFASRRQAEEMIRDGRVTLNGTIAELGQKADPEQDHIKIDGKLITASESKVYYAFNKPAGVLSMVTKDPEGRPTLKNFLDSLGSRVFPVDHLEFNGEGLMLITNDGALLEKLQRNQEVVQGFEVRISGHAGPDLVEKLKRGTVIQGKQTKPIAVSAGEKLSSKMKVDIWFQGMGSLDVKQLFENRGFLVQRIIRTQIGQIKLKEIGRGSFRTLKKSQITALVEQPELALKDVAPAEEPRDPSSSPSPRPRKPRSKKTAVRGDAKKRTGAAKGASSSKNRGPAGATQKKKKAPSRSSAKKRPLIGRTAKKSGVGRKKKSRR